MVASTLDYWSLLLKMIIQVGIRPVVWSNYSNPFCRATCISVCTVEFSCFVKNDSRSVFPWDCDKGVSQALRQLTKQLKVREQEAVGAYSSRM